MNIDMLKGAKPKLIASLFVVILGLGFYKAYEVSSGREVQVSNENEIEKKEQEGYNSRTLFTNEDLEKIRAKWERRISEVGAEKTWEEIKEEYKGESFINQHNIAHYFGESLYEIGGYDQILVCDTTFAWGCYMGMFIEAIEDRGIESVDDFYQVCKEEGAGIGCQHGIGHAISEYLGSGKLEESLDICWNMEWHGPIGCAGGALMEYFFPGWFGGKAPSAKLKEFDPENPYDQCLDLPVRYQEACIFRLTEWWAEIYSYKKDNPEILCRDLDGNLGEICFMGLGSALTEGVNYDVEETVNICNAFVTEEGRELCKMGASRRLVNLGKRDACKGDENCLQGLDEYLQKWPRED
jgi:hypothetical protein